MSKRKRLMPCGLVHTPESLQALESWIERHPNGPEKVHIWTAAMMAWNLACQIDRNNYPEVYSDVCETSD